MSEAKFTKGPWEVMPEQVTGGYLVKPVDWSRGVCTVTQRDPHPLRGQGIDWDQAEANARLIAAAPAMHLLLERLTDHSNSRKRIVHLLGEADSLIARINGEQR